MKNDKTLLIKGLKELNIYLDENQVNQFLTYYELLIEKNKVMNLTSITDYNEVIYKHFIDSLTLSRVCNLKNELSIIDLGTGAGFPGIPLKIAFPNLTIVLLDSLNKRINFLNDVIDTLELKGIQTIHGRAEDYGKNVKYRENFDICVSRAVANLSTLSEYCMPYVKVGGMFISYKSGSVNDELNDSKIAINILGGKLLNIDSFQIPGTDIDRTLIVINKDKNTPIAYPRRGGKPQKEPIMEKKI